MRKLRALLIRIAGVFTGRHADDDLRDEFAAHIELQTADNIRRGMTPAEAHRQAMMAAGGLTTATESVRARRSLPFVETLITDIRYGARGLRRNSGFTIIAVTTLALGIGANSAIFSVVSAVVLRPLAYTKSNELVTITSTRNGLTASASVPDFVDWRHDTRTMSGLAAGFTGTTVLTGNGDPESLSQARVTANAFDVLAIKPLVGRAFLPGEDDRSAPRVAMLGEGLWRRKFAADRAVVGKTLLFDGIPTTIIGVAPASLQWPASSEVWMTTRFTQRDLSPDSRGARWLDVVGRVAPTATVQTAQTEMTAIAHRLELLDPKHNAKVSAAVTPLLTSMVADLQRPLFVLLGAVGFVLLIACANVASLTLGRIATRDSELAVRTALGAGRGRIARQIVTESLMLALLGGVLGVLLAIAGIKALVAIAPGDIPRLAEIRLDAGVLLFAFVLTLLTGALFGVVPALQGAKVNLHQRLRSAGRGALGNRGSARSRRMLVVAEMSLAIVLLAGAGLLLRSFSLLRDVNPGFRAEQVATFSVALPPSAKYESLDQQRQFTSQLLSEIARTPGVVTAAATFGLPLSGDTYGFTFEVLGKPAPPPDNEPRAQVRVGSAAYFTAMNIPLVRGRMFNEHDIAGNRQVIVISQELARRYFANEDPIGQYLQTGWNIEGKRFGGEVIGVVGDVRQFALDRESPAHMYMSYEQWPLNEYDVVVRSTAPPATVFRAARATLKEIDPQIPLNHARTLVQIVEQSMGQRRFYLTLLSAFAALAMTLALVGIYGVISYSVQQRRREIGIRLALGATHRSVVNMVLSEGFRLVAIGVVVGLAGTYALTTLLKSLLFQVGTRDPLTFAVAPALLTLAAMLACVIPALQAAKQNPVETIRAD